jgi:HEAT repeat protein
MNISDKIRHILLANATPEQSPFLSNDVFDQLQQFDVETVLDQLEWAFAHPNPLVSLLALDVCPQYRSKADRLIPALSGLLSNHDDRVRFGAVSALGARRKAAVDAIPLIEPLLDTPNEMELLVVAEALWMISGHTHAKAKAVLTQLQARACLAQFAKAALRDDALELY